MSNQKANEEKIAQLEHQISLLTHKIKETEEIRENSKKILKNAIDPILIISGDTFIDCNQATVAILGASNKEEVLSTHPSELSPEYQPDGQTSYTKANKMIQTAFREGFHRFEWIHRKLNGETFPVEVSLTKIRIKGEDVLHTLWKDLTNQKRIETTLRQALRKSDQENYAKSAFLSSVSHELRTPLNSILGFAQVIKYDQASKFNDDTLESLDHIISSGNHLLGLINDLLDLSKIESGHIELTLESIHIRSLIEESMAFVQNSLKKWCNVPLINEIDLDGTATVFADRLRLREVLLNLLSNALKYTPNGNVTVTTQILQDAMLRIRVTDTGIGIPENELEEVFKPFARLGAEKSEIEGNGIGLAIAKNLIELMSGRIGFDSKAQQGSSFWIDIPLETNIPIYTATKNHLKEQSQYKPPQIDALYIEDNLSNIVLMKKIFSTLENASLETKLNAEEGIETAREHKPNIILLDINQPGMSGLDAIKILNTMPETAEIPIIALSASASEKDIERGKLAGFSAYLTKPLDIPLLKTVLEDLTK